MKEILYLFKRHMWIVVFLFKNPTLQNKNGKDFSFIAVYIRK